VSNQIFTDMSAVVKAAAAYAKAQAMFNAAAKQCGLVMKPLHDGLQEADAALKQSLNTAAADEAKVVTVDLAALLATAQAEQAAAEVAAALAASQIAANEALTPADRPAA
jgi:hypothetical protein